MTSVTEIKNLITVLPEKDQAIAESFLETRNFENLKELVDSDIIILEKHLEKLDEGSEEFIVADSNLNALSQLKGCVDEYAAQLDYNSDEYGDEIFPDEGYDDSTYLDHLYYMFSAGKNKKE